MDVTKTPLIIIPESTPNPASTRYSVNQTLLQGAGCDFPSADAAKASPLAAELFRLDGVCGVYIGPDFVTVSVKPGTNDWALQPLVMQTIESHIASGQAAVNAGSPAETAPPRQWSELEAGITRVLETEIRPAVAMDGGDIVFAGCEKGVVRLHLRGSCHSCPSSILTLKAGIERRLKQEFPEIVSVEAV